MAKFAAVAEDGEVVAQICTSFAYAPGAKLIKEALLKVQSDALKILWLENTPAKRLMLFTDPDMVRVVKEERRKSHFPKEIELVRVKLPAAIQSDLDNARNTQSPTG